VSEYDGARSGRLEHHNYHEHIHSSYYWTLIILTHTHYCINLLYPLVYKNVPSHTHKHRDSHTLSLSLFLSHTHTLLHYTPVFYYFVYTAYTHAQKKTDNFGIPANQIIFEPSFACSQGVTSQ
jgi:hypothetical protein